MHTLTTVFWSIRSFPSIALFFLLREPLGVAAASHVALTYSLVFTLVALAWERESKLDFGIPLFWAIGALGALTNPAFGEWYFLYHFTTFLYGSLFLMAYLPVVCKAEPFTVAFARRGTPPSLWNTAQFRAINKVMTLAWAGLFLFGFVLSLMPAGPLVQVVLPMLAMAAIGIPLVKKFPGYYLKRWGMAEMTPSAPLSAAVNTLPPDNLKATDQERKAGAERLGAIRKVLVIFGSPRGKKGMTYRLLERFLEGIRSAGVEPELITLADRTIRPCVGCFTCWTKTPGVCIHHDDMPELLGKVNEADLVVYAQPLYIFSVPGIVKNFLDRCLPRYEPYLIETTNGATRHPRRDKRAGGSRMLIFSVCGFPEPGHFAPMLAMFRHLAANSGVPLVGEILKPAAESLRFGERLGAPYQRLLDTLGEAGRQVVAQGYVSAATEAAITAPLFPEVDQFRQVANRFWETCINYERDKKAGRSLPPLEQYLQEDPGMFFAGMASIYDPARVENFAGKFQFNLIEPEQGTFSLEIRDGKCRLQEGEVESPDVVVHTPFALWKAISNGEISGQDAFMRGLYQASGDIGLLSRMREVFGR